MNRAWNACSPTQLGPLQPPGNKVSAQPLRPSCFPCLTVHLISGPPPATHPDLHHLSQQQVPALPSLHPLPKLWDAPALAKMAFPCPKPLSLQSFPPWGTRCSSLRVPPPGRPSSTRSLGKRPSLSGHLSTCFLSFRSLPASGTILAVSWCVIGFSLQNGSPWGFQASFPERGPRGPGAPKLGTELGRSLGPHVFLSALLSDWFPLFHEMHKPLYPPISGTGKGQMECKSPLDGRE